MKKIKPILISLLIIINYSNSISQIIWETSVGGPYYDEAVDIVSNHTNDGFVVLGTTWALEYPNTVYYYDDIFISNIDESGSVVWQKQIKIDNYQYACNILKTNDGGYLVLGQDINNGILISKLSGTGDNLWSKTLPYHFFSFTSIVQTKDNGFMICGTTYGNVGYDIFLMKIDSSGNLQWYQKNDNLYTEFANSLIYSSSNDKFYVVGSGSESFITCFDENGIVLWTINDPASARSYNSITITSDNKLLVSGRNGDSIFVKKINLDGVNIWSKNVPLHPQSLDEKALKVFENNDKGIIVGGYSNTGSSKDFIIINLDSEGEFISRLKLGGTEDEYLYNIIQTSNDDFVLVGKSESKDGDISGNIGDSDGWVVKIDEIVEESLSSVLTYDSSFSIYPKPSVNSFTLTFPNSKSYNASIIEISGKVLMSLGKINSQKTEVDVSHLENGIYLLKLSNETEQIIERIVVARQ